LFEVLVALALRFECVSLTTIEKNLWKSWKVPPLTVL
jgi:hypothetical protein